MPMLKKSRMLRVHWMHFVLLGAVTVVSQSARGQTHLVTIDTESTQIEYHDNGSAASAYYLTVGPGETIAWKVHTKDNHTHAAAIFFKNGKTPLVDPHSGGAVYAIAWSDRDANSVVTKVVGNTGEEFDYYVIVFDEVTSTLYPDDPKIIIGTGHVPPSEELSQALMNLRRAKAALSNNSDAQKQIDSIQRQLEALLKEVK